MKFNLTANTVALAIGLYSVFRGFIPTSGALIPNADTPVFYLVATDPYTENDTFLPLRLFGNNNQSTLTGIGPVAKLYYINGTLVAEDPVNGADSPYLYHPYVDFTNNGNEDDCTAQSGPLVFIQPRAPDGTTTAAPACAAFRNFFLFSDRMDQQLGAKLQLNNNLTSFYSCGKQRDIYYKIDVSNEPADCIIPVQLYTLPVV